MSYCNIKLKVSKLNGCWNEFKWKKNLLRNKMELNKLKDIFNESFMFEKCN